MNAELLDKIDKFRLMVTLKTGFNLDTDQSGSYDFCEAMEHLAHIAEVRKDPHRDPDLSAALYATDLGITLNDFSHWWEHQEALEEQRQEQQRLEQQRERTEFEQTIPELIKLKTVNKLEKIEGKQFPKHYHFKFTRKAGKEDVEITCRLFQPRYGRYRLWYQFKNPTTKKNERHMVEGNTYWFASPKWFPDWWKGRWSASDRNIAMAFAYAMTSTWSREFGNLVKPK
jgi:cell division protein YceG involved in septum cleavage